jgi:hypothetical protein
MSGLRTQVGGGDGSTWRIMVGCRAGKGRRWIDAETIKRATNRVPGTHDEVGNLAHECPVSVQS